MGRNLPVALKTTGGHSLVPAMKLRLAAPPDLVDLGALAELRGIKAEGGTLSIGVRSLRPWLKSSDSLMKIGLAP